MTLIECFDPIPLRNVVACLHLQPQKLIFLGDMTVMEQDIHRYRDLFAQRTPNTQLELCHVRLDDPEDIVSALMDIISEEEQCVIDVTGGEEQLIMAAGIVLGRLDESHTVKVQKFLLDSTAVPDHDGCILPGEHVKLTAAELIALHGGTIHPQTEQPGEGYGPEDLQALWKAVCGDSRDWNKAVSYMNEFEKRSESKTQIYLQLDDIAAGISSFEKKEEMVRKFLEKLERCGVVRNRSTARVLRYDYLDPMLQDCVKKAGNLLEFKTLLEARALRVDGKPYFHDCQVGVHIDWDGVIYDPEERVPETRNEIDAILMRGITPLFISCKNGDIEDDELYKLNTVAERFGGPHARKLLIATDLERKSPMSYEAYRQRAEDMGISLVSEAAELSSAQWKQKLLEAMEKEG